MEIVLGVSMTPTTVRMVLVEGKNADGVTVDHDVFDITAIDGSATSSAPEQVIAAVLGTRESSVAGGHRLVSTGVTWSDHSEAAALRDALALHGIDDVMLFSELHAAGALAQAVGRAVGYDKTALLFVERDTATLSVVETADGSIVKVLSRGLHNTDAMGVLTDMATSVEAHDARPDGMFVVGSGVDVASVKAHLEHLVSIPVSAPEDGALALARGAALAAANAPVFEASTVGLAYSQDPDGITAGAAYAADPAAETQLAAVSDAPNADTPEHAGRKPFLLVGSALSAIFVVGVVALVISLAVSIRPTADQRPNPAGNVVVAPSTAAPPPPAAQPPAQNAQPSPQTPPPVATVVQQVQPQAPPPTAEFANAPAPQAPAPAAVPPPAPAAASPAPAAAPPAPAAVPPPPQAPPAPAPVDPPAAPPPVYTPPPAAPPVYQQPPLFPLRPFLRPRLQVPPGYEAPQYPSNQYPSSQYPQYPSQGSGGYGQGSGSYGPGYGSGNSGPAYGPGGYGSGGSGSSMWPYPGN
ncbi:MAG TPA: hypothetical protein VMU34_20585 [Mycobacterium sp.]|nr:hypothetical protein [Mycobacterium sp.]